MLKRTYKTMPYFLPKTGDLITKWQLAEMLKPSEETSDGDWSVDNHRAGGVLVVSNQYEYWTMTPVNGTDLYSVYNSNR